MPKFSMCRAIGWLSGIWLAAAVGGCTSPYKAHELDDDEFQTKGQTGDGALGLNGKDEIELKSETSASQELQVQERVNTDFEDQVKSQGYALHDCRKQLASPNLGGNGVIPDDSDVSLDKLRPKVDARDDFGLDKQGELKYVHKEYYADRLEAERKYEKNLRKALATIKERNESCQTSLEGARGKAGVAAKPDAAPQESNMPPPPADGAGTPPQGAGSGT